MAKKRNARIELGKSDEQPDGALTHSPFAAWATDAKGKSPSEDGGNPEVSATKSDPAGGASSEARSVSPRPARPARTARIRHERKGHGGKTVTVVEFEPLDASLDVSALARDLGKALGTRAREVDGALVVQGDVRDRVQTYLADAVGMRTSRGTQ